jgi:hypothetical protein
VGLSVLIGGWLVLRDRRTCKVVNKSRICLHAKPIISVCRLIAGTSEAATYIFTASRDHHHHHHHHHHLDTKQKKKVIRKSGIAGKNFKTALAVVDQSAGAWSERPSASHVT